METLIMDGHLKVEELKRVEKKVRELVRSSWEKRPYLLNNSLYNVVASLFAGLRPFSDSTRYVCDVSAKRKLYVADVLTVKGRSYSYSLPNFRYPDYDKEFYRLITKFGDEIAENVRAEIRDLFKKMVELTRQLKPFKEVYEHVVNPPFKLKCLCYRNIEERGKLREAELTKITVSYRDGGSIIAEKRCKDRDNCRRTFQDYVSTVYNTPTLFEASQILDLLAKAVAKTKEEINEALQRNKEIIKEMDKACGYVLSSSK